MENKLEQKLIELDDKAFLLEETEAEIYQYETQIESFQRELEHLKDMEQKYLQENEDLYYRI
jgi:prefoldin subunit 5